MISLLPFILLAVAAGVCLPTQAGINAELNVWTRSPIWAATISFAVGTLALLVYALAFRISWPPADTISRHPWWIWTGGFIGAFFVVATIVLAPRLGSASMVAIIVAGQLLTSLVLDHFGLIGYPVQTFSALKLAGVFLVVCGVVLIKLF